MYLKYINADENLPDSWKEFFDNLGETKEDIYNELKGPSWSPKKINIRKISNKTILQEKEISLNENITEINKQKEDSIKVIALIRAYRIRGHLIADLDPLGLMERKFLKELDPKSHGFKTSDYSKNIYYAHLN